jgi:hypothetical protein
MISLNDYIDYAKTHGRESAKFLTTFNGAVVYIGTRSDNKMRMTGYPLLMTEKQNKVIALSHEEINRVLASMPDDEYPSAPKILTSSSKNEK